MVVLALASITAWIVLCFRGGFWRVPIADQPAAQGKCDAPVVAVIPARDEAAGIAETLRSLFAQDYEGDLRLVLVDDHSGDDTAEIARQYAASTDNAERLTIIAGSPLPPGWTGKLWAVSQGLAEARRHNPEFILLTDADISHAPDNLRQCVLRARAENADLVSLMVRLRCGSLAEKFLIPAFVFFFFMLYPPRWVADSRRSTAAAAGGCMLVRPRALDAIGGVEAIRNALIDDCALAAAIKKSGGAVRLYATRTTFSTRSYESAGEIWSMIARSAFAQLRYSALLLAVALAGIFVVFMAPPFLLLSGNGFAGACGLVAWIAMCMAIRPMLGLYEISPAWGLALPAIALFYASATFGSAVNYWRGKGGRWKGRAHSPGS